MLLGDSWAHIMWNNRTYKDVFDQFGFADKTEHGVSTAISGTTANFWAQPSNLTVIVNELQQNPAIDIVLISIGGNDLLAGINGSMPGWHTGLNTSDESLLFDRIQADIQAIISGIKGVRPSIEIVFSGYDYVNFVETVLNNPTGPIALTWANLGQPNPLQLNSAFARFEQRKIDIANADSRVHYVQGFGLMQYVYGYPGIFPPYFVPAPGQQPPSYTPFPGGDVNYPTPPAALAANGTDAIHLSDEGYKHLVVNQMVAYFLNKFRGNPNATFQSEGGLNDGWVRSDFSLGAGAIRTGDNGSSVTYRGIISFNTDAIPDNATVRGASLFLNRAALSGTNPFLSGLQGAAAVDVKTGTFGGAGVELTDYFEPADAVDAGCFIGAAPNNGYTIRVDLKPAGFNSINKSGRTQFRIYFQIASGSTADYIEFNTGDQPGLLAPYLDVFYSLPAAPATAALSGDTTVCPDSSAMLYVTLSGTPPFSLTWSDGYSENNIQSSPHIRIVTPSATTDYQITAISDANGAGTASGTAHVEVSPAVSIAPYGDTDLCTGESVVLSSILLPSVNLQWQHDGRDLVGETANVVSVNQSGIYRVKASDSRGCVAYSNEIPVVVHPLPLVSVTGDTDACQGDIITLHAAYPGATAYQWLTADSLISGATDSVFTTTAAGNYRVIITDNFCADTSDVIEARIHPHPEADAGSDTAICEGSSIELTASGGITYRWSTGDTTATVTVSPPTHSSYIVEAADSFACVDADTVNVLVHDTAQPSIIARGDTLASMLNHASYQWYRDGTVIDGADDEYYVTGQAGYYYLKVTDSNGCKAVSNILYHELAGIHARDVKEITIFPNPTSGLLYASAPVKLYSVLIFCVLGKLLMGAEGLLQSTHITLNLKDLPSGVYLLKANGHMVAKVLKK